MPLLDDGKFKSKWDDIDCKRGLDTLMNGAATQKEKARISATSQEHASDWLQAFTVLSLGLKIENRQFKTAVALRHGERTCREHICVCGQQVTSDGIHGLSCRK